MKLIDQRQLDKHRRLFDVLDTTERSQIASMVLKPGEVSGEYGNEHEGSDQILYVLSGSGSAIVQGREFGIAAGDLVLIEAGENHQVRNSGDSELKTLNFYSPPAY